MKIIIDKLRLEGEVISADKLEAIAHFDPQMDPDYYTSNYLCWPVRMNNSPLYHITLKYFGDAYVPANEIKEVIKGFRTDGPSDFAWEPTDWSTDDDDIHVLKLMNCPDHMFKLQKKFDHIRKDDFDYNPHISVEKELWDQISSEVLEAEDLKLSVGKLSLMSGKVVIETF